MKQNGFIQLHRTLLTWAYHNNPTMLSVWTHLLMLAEFEDCEKDGITVHRGELLISQTWLAEYIGISISQVRTCLDLLVKAHEITRQRTNGLTLIKILKYNDYQAITNSNHAPDNVPNHALNHAPNHDNEININNKQQDERKKKERNSGDTGNPGISGKSGISGKPGNSVTPEEPQRRSFALRLDASEPWKYKCCRDYNIDPSQMKQYIVAFHEHLIQKLPGKTWLSFNDFCLHFHSWLRFQSPDSIRNLYTQAFQRSRRRKAKQIEQERQQQMWQEIEETKRKAVSYGITSLSPLTPSP